MRLAVLSLFVLTMIPSLWLESAFAVQPSERLLPPTTKGYISVPDVDLLREHFNQTQLGELAQNPLMRPFFEDFRAQLEAKLSRTDIRLSITIEDLEDVYGGEVCLATVQPGGDEKQHATVLLVDITGRRQQADALLARIAAELTGKGARRSVQAISGVNLITYVLPRREGETEVQQAFYFIRGDQLVASDHQATVRQVLGYVAGAAGARLAELPAFQVTMARCAEAAGETPPHIRWFVEPFGYVQTVRAAAGGRRRRGTDMLRVLQREGFSAIQGIGGFLSFAGEGADIVHRTFVYAPPVDPKERYQRAARMLRFPNVTPAAPEPWVPPAVANYLSFQWDMQNAFEYSQTLVDEIAGAPVFEDILDSLEHDPNGPQINVRQGLVQHLGERVTFFTDYRLPVTPTSERWLMAFQVTDQAVVATTLDRAMEVDPDATQRMIGEHRVWEILREEEAPGIEELDIAGVGFGELDAMDDGEGAPLLEHAALTVSFGYLIVASHADFLEEVFAGAETRLEQTDDFARVNEILYQLGGDEGSFRLFSRTDKAYHTTYELFRQGRMPEADTMVATILNRLLGPEERGVLREQHIRGDQLPEYEQIQHYFGPAGAYVQTRNDGWFVCGALLANNNNAPQPADETAVEPADAPAASGTPD